MAKKKPIEPTPKNFKKRASKKTRDTIAYFEGRKPIGDIFEKEDGRKKLKLSPAAGKPTRDPILKPFWKWIEGKGSWIVLVILTAAVSGAIYWMMMQ